MAAYSKTTPRLGLTKYLHKRVTDQSGDQTSPEYYFTDSSSGAETSAPANNVLVENFITDDIQYSRGDCVL